MGEDCMKTVDYGDFILHHGANLEVLRGMADNSVDSIVTDPPYGLTFMGKKWDYDVPSVEQWAECLRVLKPGGHLLSFAGTRTQHRMCVRIEDAGFEIRDMLCWMYGSGFPKSHDVSKALDAAAGAERERGAALQKIGTNKTRVEQGHRPNEVAQGFAAGPPVTDAARQWEGWGTALKPALEPITMARKPLIGTVAANILAHGVGGLNIDASRVGDGPGGWGGGGSALYEGGLSRDGGSARPVVGRWPANLIHDGSDEALAAFPQAPGQLADVSTTAPSSRTSNVYGAMRRTGEPSADSENSGAVGFKMKPGARRLDAGSAARFFYCSKASRADRGEGNTHPTVKPTDLMRYLVTLVTPPGGTVLDPWMGSGSTGKAAVPAGFKFIGIDRDNWLEIAARRIAAAHWGPWVFRGHA